jgi:hypothetical protein
VKVLNEYPGSHHYWDEFEKEPWHCPNCGQKELWTATGSGDYYVGNESICTACGHACYLLSGPKEIKEPHELGQLKQLREGKTAEPTTRRGN